MKLPVLLLIPLTFAAAKPRSEAIDTGGIVRFSQDVRVGPEDTVKGPVVVFGGSIMIEGKVDGPVVALGGPVSLKSGARVDGPVVDIGGEMSVEKGSSINGPVVHTPGAALIGKVLGLGIPLAATGVAFAVVAKAAAGLGWFVLALVLWLLFPEAVQRTSDALAREPKTCAVIGILAGPALAVINLALVVSLVGIPFLPLIALAAAGAYIWGLCALSFYIGGLLAQGRWSNPVYSLAVGMLLLKILQVIPFVGLLVWLAAAVMAVGVSVLTRFGTRA